MKNTLFLLLSMALISCSTHNEINIEKVIEIYDTGDKERAKELFIALSKQGNYNADFELAYRYVNNYEDRYKYLRTAAMNGHEKAIDSFLDMVLFRSNSLTKTNPKDALYVYKKYLEKRNINENDKKGQLTFLIKCSSIPNLDINTFCKKYSIKNNEALEHSDYYIWQLAEEASRVDGRFGKPNPELILQLILRGGMVPAELTLAVNDFYEYYKKNEVHEFNIDTYVTSGDGMNFCTMRAQKKLDMFYKEKRIKLSNNFTKENQKMFLNAIEAYHKYINEKIFSEEGHDGSGYITWAYDSANKQKETFFEYIEQLLTIQKINVSEKNINDMFVELEKLQETRDKRLKASPIHGVHFIITLEAVHHIDVLWETHRVSIVNLIEKQCNAKIAQELNKWIYRKRIEDLNNVIELFIDYPIEN